MKILFNRTVERLIVFKESINDWIKTNWIKITEKVGDIIVSKSVRYKSRCWSCKESIESIKSEYKMVGWVQNTWLGNKKCSRQNCNYFICNNCGKCLCDSRHYSHLKSRKPVMKKWQTEEKTSRIKVIKEFIKYRKK
jgi:hypothetical protein|tara:strand:- start:123 stop:533 length:411 start_codon:yes stop_codon:yes gene_type:complete